MIGQRSTAPAIAISLVMMLSIADTRGNPALAVMASRSVLFYLLFIYLFANSVVNYMNMIFGILMLHITIY